MSNCRVQKAASHWHWESRIFTATSLRSARVATGCFPIAVSHLPQVNDAARYAYTLSPNHVTAHSTYFAQVYPKSQRTTAIAELGRRKQGSGVTKITTDRKIQTWESGNRLLRNAGNFSIRLHIVRPPKTVLFITKNYFL